MLEFITKMSTASTTHPVWQVGAILLLATVAVALVLQLIVQTILPAMLRQEHTVSGAAIFTVIGTTYAVLLAFMATTAWEQYSAAESLAGHEADAIGSIYLASRGLNEPVGGIRRSDTKAYVANVIAVEWPTLVTGHLLQSRSHSR